MLHERPREQRRSVYRDAQQPSPEEIPAPPPAWPDRCPKGRARSRVGKVDGSLAGPQRSAFARRDLLEDPRYAILELPVG
jgi:hypothetical protein